jgi:hypothetical protein
MSLRFRLILKSSIQFARLTGRDVRVIVDCDGEICPPPRGPQSMSDKPKRPWFRFHLLTLVLMMLAAGGLLGANIFTPRAIVFEKNVSKDPRSNLMRDKLTFAWSGWPIRGPQTIVIGAGINPEDQIASMVRFNATGRFRDYRTIIFNVLIAIGLVLIIAIILEYILRRREGRRDDRNGEAQAPMVPIPPIDSGGDGAGGGRGAGRKRISTLQRLLHGVDGVGRL